MEVFTDEEYQKVVIPDEEKFLDRSKASVIPTDLVTMIDE